MPINPAAPSSLDPVERLVNKVAELERRLAQLEKLNFEALELDGNNGSDGKRVRVELGLTASGRYGLRVYDSSGSLVHDYTTVA